MAFDPWTYTEKYGKGRQAEHANQVALFMWANMAQRFGLIIADSPLAYTKPGWAMEQAKLLEGGAAVKPIPQLKWLHAIHNQGHGDAIRGAKARAEGVKAGVFDLFLPVGMFTGDEAATYIGNGHYCWHGLYLELKVGSNKPSNIQNEFAEDMMRAGYATAVAWGWLDARQKILDYLNF